MMHLSRATATAIAIAIASGLAVAAWCNQGPATLWLIPAATFALALAILAGLGWVRAARSDHFNMMGARDDLEAQYRESESRMRDFAMTTNGWLWETDTEGRFTFMSDSIEKLAGVSPEANYGKTRRELAATSYGDEILKEMERREAARLPIDGFEYRYAPAGNAWMRTSGKPRFGRDGRFLGYRGVACNIDQEKRQQLRREAAEKALKRTRTRFLDAIQTMDSAVSLWDSNDRLTLFNDKFVAMNTKIADKIRAGMSFEALLRHKAKTGAVPAGSDRETWVRERLTLHRRANGSTEVTLDGTTSLLIQERRTSDGATVTIATDITALRQAQEQAEQASRAKSDFLATVSHEIRTPLNGVLGMTHLLAETALSEQQKHYLDILQRSGEALMTIINDVLDYSKIEAGRLEIEEKPFDLQELIDSVLDPLGPAASNDGLALVVTTGDQVPPQWLGDANRLRQILYNLIGNGIKFTREGGVHLSVSAETLPDGKRPDRWMLKFSVEDTGIGISAEAQNQLFRRFSQADPATTREFGGTGLGLAICRQLVELMDGTISVESMVGRGSRFSFQVPLAPLARGGMSGANRYSRPQKPTATAAIVVSANPFLQAWFRDWLPEVCEHARIVDSPAAARRALAEIKAKGADSAITVILSWDAASWEGLADLGSELSENGATSMGVLAPLALVSEPNVRRAMNGWTHLPVPATDRELRRFLRREDQLASETAAIVPKGAKVIALHHADPARPAGHDGPPANGRIGEAMSLPPSAMPRRLLLVEDNHVNQTVTLAMLGMTQEYEIEIATDGSAALARLRNQPYDLILMDVQMPEMDGLEATRRIRQLESDAAAVPIIGMTAHAFPEDRERCLAAGMDDYISKPVDRALLLKKVRHWLAHGYRAAAPSG